MILFYLTFFYLFKFWLCTGNRNVSIFIDNYIRLGVLFCPSTHSRYCILEPFIILIIHLYDKFFIFNIILTASSGNNLLFTLSCPYVIFHIKEWRHTKY